MTERRNRLSEVFGDTLARLTTDSSVASVVAYLQDYERLVLDSGLSPDSLVPTETDVQAIFRLILDLRTLTLEVPQANARDRFMRQVAIARADYLADRARKAARRSKANSIAAGVAAVCILAATASVAGATSDLPKVTLPVSLQDIVDAISPSKPADQNGSQAAPTLPSNVSSANQVTGLTGVDSENSGISADGLPGVAELRQVLETLQSTLLDEQTASPAASGDVTFGAETSKGSSQAPLAPNTASSTQSAAGQSTATGSSSVQSGSVASQPSTPATQPATSPVDMQPGSDHSGTTGGQSASAPGVTGATPGQSGSTPGQSGGGGGSQPSTAPGLTGSTPGLNDSAPGLSGSTPGQSSSAPGNSGSAPGNSGSSPGQSDATPGGLRLGSGSVRLLGQLGHECRPVWLIERLLRLSCRTLGLKHSRRLNSLRRCASERRVHAAAARASASGFLAERQPDAG